MAFAIVISLVLAGCTKGDEPLTQETLPTGVLGGVVTDVTLAPLAGVNVTVTNGGQSALTDAAGAFTFVLEPGEHLLVAQLEGYVNAAVRANVLAAQSIALNVTLAPVPKETPRVESQEGSGLIACAIVVESANTPQQHACPSQDANARPSLDFDVADTHGLAGAVLELDWTAASEGSEKLAITIEIITGESAEIIGHTEGTAPLSVSFPARLLEGKLVSGSALRVTAAPAGSLTDDEAGLDAGATVQQAFTAYLSLFYHEAPPAGFSVISG